MSQVWVLQRGETGEGGSLVGLYERESKGLRKLDKILDRLNKGRSRFDRLGILSSPDGRRHWIHDECDWYSLVSKEVITGD